MKKIIVLYCRRNVGLCILPYLLAKGYIVKLMTDDHEILWLAERLRVPIVELETMGVFDLFICVHGQRIIPEKYLVKDKFVNIHPCLSKYPGHNPIKRYIENGDIFGTVESQYLINEVDKGEVIYSSPSFLTGKIKTYAEFYDIALSFYFRVLDKTLEILKV